MIRWTGLAPWEFEFPFPGSLTSTFLCRSHSTCRADHAFFRLLIDRLVAPLILLNAAAESMAHRTMFAAELMANTARATGRSHSTCAAAPIMPPFGPGNFPLNPKPKICFNERGTPVGPIMPPFGPGKPTP